MNQKNPPEWDPRHGSVLTDQIAAYDRMRDSCPVAHSDYLGWSLFKHADVMRAVTDTQTFSNAVSTRHVAIPNGMDPPEHTEFRRIIDAYFVPQRINAFEPACRRIVTRLLDGLCHHSEIEVVAEFGDVFAVKAQCAFLEWPTELHEPLLQWTRKNYAATLSGDRAAIEEVAVEFDSHIRERLNESRSSKDAGRDDAVTRLLKDRVHGRPLTDEEIISILRNWTVGEVSTISACISTLTHYLALHPAIQNELRQHPQQRPSAIDEILRIHPPLIASRRLTTKAMEFGDCPISAGERVTLLWASANRDEAVFGNPDEFRLDRDPSQNLLYGAGIHYCPGAPLARLELRIVLEELLARTSSFALSSRRKAARAIYPASGFASLLLMIEWS